MKYDLSQKPTRGAQRTLDAFSGMMFELLSEKSFEDITMNELCERCSYPRATFYNYFDDKHDLLQYCWMALAREIHIEDYADMEPDESLYIFFDRIYDLLAVHKTMIARILQYNPITGMVFNHFRAFFNGQIQHIVFSSLLHIMI